jgi:Concanavalin A-like lectin/glucanases superfamily
MMHRLSIFLLAASCSTTYGATPPATGEDAGADSSTAPDATTNADATTNEATRLDGATACSPGAITDGLVAYYPLDEAQGASIKDCSGKGHDGQILRLASGTWVPGKRGSAVRVLSPDGCIDFGVGPEFRFSGAFTAMAWVNVASFPSGTGAILGKSFDLNADGWRVDSTIVTELGGVVATAGGPPLYVGRENQPTNKWLHLTVVFTPSAKLDMYIDGAFATGVAWSGALIDSPSVPFRIGCRADNGGFFDGTVDEVRLYDRALTTTEIALLSTP